MFSTLVDFLQLVFGLKLAQQETRLPFPVQPFPASLLIHRIWILMYQPWCLSQRSIHEWPYQDTVKVAKWPDTKAIHLALLLILKPATSRPYVIIDPTTKIHTTDMQQRLISPFKLTHTLSKPPIPVGGITYIDCGICATCLHRRRGSASCPVPRPESKGRGEAVRCRPPSQESVSLKKKTMSLIRNWDISCQQRNSPSQPPQLPEATSMK